MRISSWQRLAPRSAAACAAASSSSFGMVRSALVRSLRDMGIARLTVVQEEALALSLGGRDDQIVVAQTGSGKTLIFMLPLLQRLAEMAETMEETAHDANAPRALVLAPTAALALQHLSTARNLTKEIPNLVVESLAQLDGMNTSGGSAESSSQPSVRMATLLVGTPAQLLGSRLALEAIRNVSMVALDECDALLCGGNYEDGLSTIGEGLLEALPASAQYLLVTAHLTAAHEATLSSRFPAARRLAQATESGRRGTLVPTLRQRFEYLRKSADRDQVALRVLRDASDDPVLAAGTSMVFCRDAAATERLHKLIEGSIPELKPLLLASTEHDAPIGLTSGLGSDPLSDPLVAFRRGEAKVLICTYAAARGLDFPLVRHVLLRDMPTEVTGYVHCVGRTARRGAGGTVTCLVESNHEAERVRHLMQEVHALQKAPRIAFD